MTKVSTALAITLLTCSTLWAGDVIIGPPTQPANAAPGGSQTTHGGFTVATLGSGSEAVWIFCPDQPRPVRAPVVMFFHGYIPMGVDPSVYGAWIKHMVLRGYSVVYPAYETSITDNGDAMLANGKVAVTAAWKFLTTDPRAVPPDTTAVAWVGHSLGGYVAADLAAASSDLGLPPPGSLLVVNTTNWALPGPAPACTVQLRGLDKMPASTLVLAVCGDDDMTARTKGAREILAALPQVAERELIKMHSFSPCTPPLVANHYAPCASDPSILPGSPPTSFAADALDFYGYWKLQDALVDASFTGAYREYALGNTPQQTFMGLCSDGTPVTPLSVQIYALGQTAPSE